MRNAKGFEQEATERTEGKYYRVKKRSHFCHKRTQGSAFASYGATSPPSSDFGATRKEGF